MDNEATRMGPEDGGRVAGLLGVDVHLRGLVRLLGLSPRRPRDNGCDGRTHIFVRLALGAVVALVLYGIAAL